LPPPVNDLQAAARALCPAIDPVLEEVAAAGANHVLVSGSGPTVFGFFDDPERARLAAERLPGAIAVEPLR
jgi:4-diphosphocytidyl-2-C-methyl-D-erythritol kinase